MLWTLEWTSFRTLDKMETTKHWEFNGFFLPPLDGDSIYMLAMKISFSLGTVVNAYFSGCFIYPPFIFNLTLLCYCSTMKFFSTSYRYIFPASLKLFLCLPCECTALPGSHFATSWVLQRDIMSSPLRFCPWLKSKTCCRLSLNESRDPHPTLNFLS